ncbi:MAG TPA: sugar-binding protein [Candidatus Dormibacteraeota bacterium]|nr:sugar-binding protein [Candidatus Dormibacteraeota bacterium]
MRIFARGVLRVAATPQLLLSTVLLCAAALPAAANNPPPTLTLPAAPAPMINGDVNQSWGGAATVHLDYDFTYHRPATSPAAVRVAQDGTALYVAFEITQKGVLMASQHTNGSSVLSDDYVGVYLSPRGTQGFLYAFFANPIGTRYQTSSENSAYSPEWTAIAHSTPNGYDVTMRIPLSIIRSGGSHDWRMQFVRFSQARNSLDVWAYSSIASSPSDPTFIGMVKGVGVAAAGSKSASVRNPARLQLYGLGEATSRINGGSTSRVGADFSLPIDPTASFVGTLHPDYSNVESDQQTIAPTAFARQYVEVRPFFTQLASVFNYNFICVSCPLTLYTPAIPTFSQGYGAEGTQGRVSFAAFDALGVARTDQAETANYSYEDPRQMYGIETQRVAVDAYGLHDDTSSLDFGYLNQHTHFGVYGNNAFESGSLVTDGAQAQDREYGLLYSTATSSYVAGVQRIGAQFNPLDGYVAQNDIFGYQSLLQHTFNFTPSSWLHDVSVQNYYARYNNHLGLLAQTDEESQVKFDLKNLLSVKFYATSQGIRTVANEFLPFNGNGVNIGYRENTNTPSYVQYTGGPYYHGELDAWTYLLTLPVTRRIHLTLETDQDRYLTTYPGEVSSDQWLERPSLDWQPNKAWQFDLGVRRIVGPNLPNAFQALTYESIYWPTSTCNIATGNPYQPGCFVKADNVSLALHYLRGHNEFYFVYGNANNLNTEPALFAKWILYIGAQKGQ